MNPMMWGYIFLLTVCNMLTMFFLKKLSMVFIARHTMREFYYLLSFKEFYLAAFAGGCSVTLFIYINALIELSRFIPLLMGMVMLLTSTMGIVVFHEPVTVHKILGFVTMIMALILLSK